MTDTWKLDVSPNSFRRLDLEMRKCLSKHKRSLVEIESIVSRTWISAGRTFRGQCSLRHFLHTVLCRKAVDYDRAAERRPWFLAKRQFDPKGLPCGDLSAEDRLHELATKDRVDAALAEIPAHYADVLRLALQGYDHFAVADTLGIKYHTARSRYSRGKKLLLELLARGGSIQGASDDDDSILVDLASEE